jgi:uncharacterized protein HemX
MGLWKHKQKCLFAKNLTNATNEIVSELKDINNIDKDGLIIKLLKDNEEILQILKEVLPKMYNNTTINERNERNERNKS